MNILCTVISLLCIYLYPMRLEPVVQGSDSIVSIQPFYIFPTGDSTNQMATFGFFQNGFGLQDASTTCTFSSIFPVSGFVSLHAGQLYLGTDLIVRNITSWGSDGTIIGNDHAVDLCASITGLAMTSDMNINNATMYLNNDVMLSGTAKFTGSCVLDARGGNMSLGSNANIIVGHNATLRLRNVELEGIATGRIQCLDDSAKLILDNVRWVQSGDYTFTHGSIEFDNQVNFVGPHIFTYASALTSTIDSASTWYLSDVVKLTIGRTGGIFSREPLYFADSTSILKLENCTLAITPSGMSLTNGTMVVSREIFVEINSTSTNNGLLIGNGTSANDPMISLYPDAAINLLSGYLVNNVTRASTFSSHDTPITYVQSGNSVIYDQQNTNYSNVNVSWFGSGGSLIDPGKILSYNDVSVTLPSFSFNVTATRYSAYALLLAQGGLVDVTLGAYPLASVIEGSGNNITAVGDISGPIILIGNTAQLTVAVGGTMLGGIALGGGSLTLGRDLTLGQDTLITGNGLVNLGAHNININLQTQTWTSTVVWNGTGSFITLKNNMHVAAPLFVQGSCVIDGQGNTLTLATAGSIMVRPHATLRFKNITLNGVGGSNICCQDNSGAIIFDAVSWIQDANFTFSNGSFKVVGLFDMVGSYTFAFSPSLASTIAHNAVMCLEPNFTFSYDAQGARTNLLTFAAATSRLYMKNMSTVWANRHGMQLANGTIIIDGVGDMVSQGTSASTGIIIGNNSAANDCVIDITPGSCLRIDNGYFVYQNVNARSILIDGLYSCLTLNAQATMVLNQPLDLAPGFMNLSNQATLINENNLNGSVMVF